ncbi:MAG: antitoxin Xre/MbcA/ParS toxin-binding domain-containing protein [Pseudomonas putida]|uniref:antitoxin Xre/MbcA/ParS toxin-binding domain-containing protein n=2 Tax=Pseudomonas TaxID=286 RepID=UPI000C160138
MSNPNPTCVGCGCVLLTEDLSSTWAIATHPAQGEGVLRLCERCTARVAMALWPQLIALVTPTTECPEDVLAIVGVIYQVMAFFRYDQSCASRWFSSPVIGLAGQCPKDLVQSEAGRQEILRLLGQLAHGVPP